MFNLAWKALRHRPARTLIALAQALVGATVVVLALALAAAQNRAANASSDVAQLSAGTSTPNNTIIFSLFSYSDLPRLKKLAPDVLNLDLIGMEFVSGLEVGQTSYKLSQSKATGPDYAAMTGLKVLHGSYFNRKDVDSSAKVVVLSSNAARALFGRENAVGEKLTLIQGGPGAKNAPYRVVAITEASLQSQQGVASPLFMPVGISSTNKAGSLILQARPGKLRQAKEQLLSAARKTYENDPQYTNLKARGQSGFFYSTLGNPFGQMDSGPNPMLRAYFTIAALTLIVSSLGVLSGLLVSVNERTRELGLRRAIGATRGQIASSLLLETLLTTLLGSVLGVLLALVLAPVLSALFGSLLNGAQLEVTAKLAGAVLGLFVLLSLLFGLVPALSSTRLRPTEALRMQG